MKPPAIVVVVLDEAEAAKIRRLARGSGWWTAAELAARCIDDATEIAIVGKIHSRGKES